MTTQETFDLAYVLSKPPAVQELWAGSLGLSGQELDPTSRINLAQSLAKQGYQIMRWDADGGDPYWSIQELLWDGYTWFPNIIQPGIATPLNGVIVPGYPQYNPSNPPAGSFILSLVPPPPFSTPPPPIINVSTTTLLGAHAFGNMWFATQQAIKTCVAGQQITMSGVTYTFTIVQTIAGLEYLWETT